ncbi:hypothetical protein FHX37_2272 [Haloactinospora alba]|uniref:DUF3558 family protein n=1 Tax=Haloactinospora alba TaxID=405555 RepID=A0A543NKD9_9ACTN|nr:hypothetical protein [Haloactinospora alba]TQN32321.1 hypothetical protein FHX37_2272 [Haloactinospora alba]
MGQPPSGGPDQRPGPLPQRPAHPHAGSAPESQSAAGASSAATLASKRSRGCAVAMVAVLAVLALLLVAGGVWAIVTLTTTRSEFGGAPECTVAEGEVLERLVADYDTETAEPISGLGQRRDGRQCKWTTSEDGSVVPAAARLVMVSSTGGWSDDGSADAAEMLRAESEEHAPEELSGIGDEARSWYEFDSGFTWGCVGVQVSNLYTATCYTASVDFQASSSIPDEEVLSEAEELAEAAVRRAADGA